MRSKTILSIAAFIVAFVLSTAFASLFIVKSEYLPLEYNTKKTSCFKNRVNSNYAAGKIETIIKQDISNGRQRREVTSLYQTDEEQLSNNNFSFADYAENVEQYVDASSSMDDGELPREFQSAWRKHMKAWRDYSDFLQKTNKNGSNIEHFDRAETRYSAEINFTWYEVLRIGRSYGAEVY
jgi:hypothetical protein